MSGCADQMRTFIHLWILLAGTAFAQISVSGGVTFSGGISFGSGTSSLCGPPGYLCSSQTTTNAGLIAAIFTSTAPTSTTCSGQCQNAVAYDTTMNATGIDPYVRVTDGSTSCGAPGQSFNATSSGGDNDNVWSVNDDYLVIVTTGNLGCILHLNVSGNAVQVINTGVPGISLAASVSSSRVTDNVVYNLRSSTQIWQNTIVNDTTLNSTELADVSASGICPGLPQPFGATWASVFNGSSTDDTFIFSLSNAGIQNTGIWTVAWSRTKGCSTANMQTGSVWGWCTSSCGPSTTPLGTLNTSGGCWGASTTHGIHDTLASLDGNYAYMTINGQWTQGACAGVSSAGYSVWQVGTTNSQWCSSQQLSIASGCVDHTSVGYSHAVSNYYAGPNIRLNSAVSSATQFYPAYSPLLEDWHSSWPAGTMDANPIIIASDALVTGNGFGCANAIYCPIYQHNEIFSLSPLAAYPPGSSFIRFGHTFSCGPGGTGKAVCTGGADFYFQGQYSIMACSPSGKHCALVSTMLGNLGLDSSSKNRQDIFVITME
jgi:hypothetical protein